MVVVVVVVGVVCRHLLDAGGDAPHRLHVRLRGRPAPCPPPFVPSFPLGSHAPSCLSLKASGALALALGPLSSPLPVSRVPPPVPHALACSLSHLPSPCPLHLGSLPAPLHALPVPWHLPGPLPVLRVPPPVPHTLARSLPHLPSPCPLHLCSLPAPFRALPAPWPLHCLLPAAPSALLPPAAAPFLDHSPGVSLLLQLRQRDARRRALARRGADVPLPPRGEGLGGERLGGAGVGVGGVGVGAVSLPNAAAAAAASEASAARAGFSPACAACWGPRRGQPRRCHGPPGSRPQPLARAPRSPSLPWLPPTGRPWPRSQPLARPPRSPLLPRRPPARRPQPVRGPSQPLARPSCSPLRPRQPPAMRPAPAPGLPPLSAACRGPRSGPRRGSPRSPLPARLSGAGRRGWLLGRRGRPSRLAQAPGGAAAARPAPPPQPASAPRAPRRSPPSHPIPSQWNAEEEDRNVQAVQAVAAKSRGDRRVQLTEYGMAPQVYARMIQTLEAKAPETDVFASQDAPLLRKCRRHWHRGD